MPRFFGCFRGGADVPADFEVVRAAPAKVVPVPVKCNMANARVPAAVVVNLLNEEVDLNQLTPRKRTRAQPPLRER